MEQNPYQTELMFQLDTQAPTPSQSPALKVRHGDLREELEAFNEFGATTRKILVPATLPDGERIEVPGYVNEFWTAKQRAASRLQEISYRACFKPQLPRFFIERLSQPNEIVYDPFLGRGTTAVEAALLGRIPYGCDVNPLSLTLTGPRLTPPVIEEVATRLKEIDFQAANEIPEDLLVFYHPETLREIVALRRYLLTRKASGKFDRVDGWVSLVALNRLTGHSGGFFSVYTLPPNQAVSIKSQKRINARRNQTPPRRVVSEIILRKSRQLLKDCDKTTRRVLAGVADQALLLNRQSHDTPEIPTGSVALVVTSPPFLNVVDYATDNWLRCWFLGIDAAAVKLTVPRELEAWQQAMTAVLRELRRVLKPGGHVAFEVGEVNGGTVRLEETVIPAGLEAGLEPVLVMINSQKFTKTANCWGVDNNDLGTNTNRIVLLRKGKSTRS